MGERRAMTSQSVPRFFGVIPAAGRSVRMGEPKLLLPWRDGTLIEHVLAQWLASRVACVTVVVHPDDQELAAVCRARRNGRYARCPATRYEIERRPRTALDRYAELTGRGGRLALGTRRHAAAYRTR